MRICLVGFGTVGKWVARALADNAERLETQYGFRPVVIGVAKAREGFVYKPEGLDLATLLELASSGQAITEHPSVAHWPTVLDGIGEIQADVLVEVSASTAPDGEPGYTHMREALRRGFAVATSNKWPVALHGVELTQIARRAGVPFRAESTVMSGTPVLSTLTEGLAGATPVAVRGILNATCNFILSRMREGASFQEALATAQQLGLAERNPAADVDGHDAVAKLMILSGLVFGRQLRIDQVVRQSIADLNQADMEAAALSKRVIRQVATLEFSEPSGKGEVNARVQPMVLGPEDPLAKVDGVTNAIVCQVEPLGDVTIVGPGAGIALAGQGVLADLIAIARA